MAGKIDYRGIVISSAVTAFTVALVNNIFNRSNGTETAKKFIASLSVQELSKFAHPTTIINVNNEKWLDENLGKMDMTNLSFAQMDKQQWGNLAFVALYSGISKYREKANEAIGALKNQLYAK